MLTEQQWSKTKALLFDNDGTLTNTMPLVYYIFNQTAMELTGGVSLPVARFNRFMAENIHAVDGLIEFCKLNGHHVEHKAVLRSFNRHSIVARRSAEQFIAPIPSTLEVIKEAKRRGLPIAVVTAGPGIWAKATIKAAGLEEFFEGSVFIHNETPGLVGKKPSLDPYLLAAKELGLELKDCLVFEDADSCLTSLRAASVPTVDVRTLPNYPSTMELPHVPGAAGAAAAAASSKL